MKRGGILGVMDSMADVLAGKQRPELGKDPDGNVYIKAHTMSRGEQWMKIAGEGMVGAAAGLAAGKGAGNMGKAPLAGMQAQQAQADRQAAQMDKAVLDSANHQMQQMKMAELAWQQTRLKAKATQEDQDWADKKTAEMEAGHAVFLGTTTHPGDIAHLQEAHPGLMKSLVGYKGAEQDLQFIPRYENGEAAGFDVYKKRPGHGATILPDGAIFHTFDPATGETQTVHVSGPTTQGQIDEYEMAYYNKKKDYENHQIEIDLKKAQEKEAKATAQEKTELLPQQKEKLGAEITHLGAETNLTREKTKQVKAGMVNDDGTPNPRFELMANALLDGDILPPDLKREAKGAGLDPNQIVGRAMEIAQARGQHFSLPIIEQEHKFAMNPKTQAALDGIDRVIGAPGAPGYIQQMLGLAKAADLGPVGAGNSIVLAVKRAYGDTAAKNLNTSIDETRRSIAGLIGNPLLGGSDTDKKLEQAKDMLGRSPTLENLDGATDVLMQALATQRNSIVQNNRYLRQRYGTRGVGGPAATAAPPPPAAPAAGGWTPPPGAPQAPAIDNKYLYDPQGKPVAKSMGGKWVQP
jgi:hypothetical protein